MHCIKVKKIKSKQKCYNAKCTQFCSALWRTTVNIKLCRIVICCHRRFLTARHYASAGLCDSNVSIHPSVRMSVRPSRAGIVSKRMKAS